MITLHSIRTIPTLMHWRITALTEVYGFQPSARTLANIRRYYDAHLDSDGFRMYVATLDGEEAGCGQISFHDEPPSPDNPTGHCAYVSNIYVLPHLRNRGVAHSLLEKLLDVAHQRDCCKIYLETVKDAKHLFSTVGFTDMLDYMRYRTDIF